MNETLLSLIRNSFGFEPIESRHHFVVDIPRGGDAQIKISEHLSWDHEAGSSAVTTGTAQDGQIRVLLARAKWDAIADEVRAQFNQRLKKIGKKAGSWHPGSNLVRRDAGHRLVVDRSRQRGADPGERRAARHGRAGLRRRGQPGGYPPVFGLLVPRPVDELAVSAGDPQVN